MITLRVAITDRCNLRCAYCIPGGGVPLTPRHRLPDLEELAELAIWVDRLYPLKKIKITGGEPLVRTGVENFILRLSSALTSVEISMTTNGTLLAGHAYDLRTAGLTRVNVSLDTPDPGRYRDLTHGGRVEHVVQGLEVARDAGLAPVKINAVLRRSSWREDVPALLDFASEHGFELRFLELMRTGGDGSWCEREFIAAEEVLGWLAGRYGSSMVHTHELTATGPAPARKGRIRWRGEDLSLGWILPMSMPFCDACNRLRLDARGRVRRCLMDAVAFPLRQTLAEGGEAAARDALACYLTGKTPPTRMLTDLPMVKLGG